MSTDTTADAITSRPAGREARERLYRYLLFACAATSIFVTVGIVFLLAKDAIDFFTLVSPVEFFTGTTWLLPRNEFGVLPLLTGTLLVTVIAAAIALPVGVAAAVYLSEYASERARSVLKPALEILAGIPTVVYGIFALVYVTPFLRFFGLPLNTFNVLSASVMVGIMIIPMVSSISEDAMNAVPDELRNAGYGLGATKFEVSTGIVVPASVSGIASSYILAISRAIGETMIVVVAMGANARLPPVREAIFGIPFVHPGDVLFDSGMTMTVAMVQIKGGDLTGGTLAFEAMYTLGLTLFVITLVMNVISDMIAERFREEY